MKKKIIAQTIYLENETIENATALPIAYIDKHIHVGGFYYKGKPIKNGLLSKDNEYFETPPNYQKHRKVIEEPAIYGGILFNHFGHFLLESLARVWAIKQNPDRIVLWRSRFNTFTSWQKDILALFGILDKSIIICESTLFKNLLIPRVGFSFHVEFRSEQVKALGIIEPEKVIPNKKLYISRTKVKESGGIGGDYTNEMELEQLLQDRGWTIYFPEEHTIQEQVAEFSSAEIAMGIEGSALHSIILLSSLDTRIYTIPRNLAKYEYNFDTIAKAKGLKYYQFDIKKIIDSNKLNMELLKSILDKSADLVNHEQIGDDFLYFPPPSTVILRHPRDFTFRQQKIEFKNIFLYYLKLFKGDVSRLGKNPVYALFYNAWYFLKAIF